MHGSVTETLIINLHTCGCDLRDTLFTAAADGAAPVLPLKSARKFTSMPVSKPAVSAVLLVACSAGGNRGRGETKAVSAGATLPPPTPPIKLAERSICGRVPAFKLDPTPEDEGCCCC